MLDLIKINNKELFVRKRIASFIEKIFNYIGCRFEHDNIKRILYAEDSFKTNNEEKAKYAYDAYKYLLLNRKNPFTNRMLNTFFFIYFGHEIDLNVSLRLATRYFDFIDRSPIESAVDFHFISLEEMGCIPEEDKFVISFMFFNYILTKNDIPTIKFLHCDFERYVELKKINATKIDFYDYFFEVILRNKFQDKSYYKNLKEISLKDIYDVILADKEYIKDKFQIKHISVFGSFAKGLNRIDSDIDLLVSFSLDLTGEEKRKLADEFKNYYLNKFNRFIDVSEISEYLNDEFIKKLPYVKKIF